MHSLKILHSSMLRMHSGPSSSFRTLRFRLLDEQSQPRLDPTTQNPIVGSITAPSVREVSSLILTSLLSSFAPVEPRVIEPAIAFYKERKEYTFSPHLDLWQNGTRIPNPTISGTDSREWIVASVITREFWQSLNRKQNGDFDSYLLRSDQIVSDELVELKEKYAKTLQGIRSICEGLVLLPPCAEKTFLDNAFGFNNNSSINYKLQVLSTKDLKFFEQLISKAKKDISLDLTAVNCFKVQWVDENGQVDQKAKAPVYLQTAAKGSFICLEGVKSTSLTGLTETEDSSYTGTDTTDPAVAPLKEKKIRIAKGGGFGRVQGASPGKPRSGRQKILDSIAELEEYLSDGKTLEKVDSIVQTLFGDRAKIADPNINRWMVKILLAGKGVLSPVQGVINFILKAIGKPTKTEIATRFLQMIEEAKAAADKHELLKTVDQLARLMEAYDVNLASDGIVKGYISILEKNNWGHNIPKTFRDAIPFDQLNAWFNSKHALMHFIDTQNIKDNGSISQLLKSEGTLQKDQRAKELLVNAVEETELRTMAIGIADNFKAMVDAMYEMYCTD